MDKDQLELIKFLEQQLEWSKEQARVLDEIDALLHEMKRIAQYAEDQELSAYEVNELNTRLKDLQYEVLSLETHLHQIVH